MLVASLHIINDSIVKPWEEEVEDKEAESNCADCGDDRPDNDRLCIGIIIILVSSVFLAVIFTFRELKNHNDPGGGKSGDEENADYPSPDACWLFGRVTTAESAARLLTRLESIFAGAAVWDKTNPVVGVIMNCVVVHVGWQTHHEERLLSLAEEKRTNRLILILADVYNILIGVDTDPVFAEKEVDGREVFVAL